MERQEQTRRTSHWLWLGPSLYILSIGLYFIFRYLGQWAESDSTTFTNIIRAFVRAGELVPTTGWIYPNGYAYQAISAFIVGLTGLDVLTLQQLVYPLLAAVVVVPAWVLYRDLTGSARGATITTVLLLTQPEFLFVILRSSHEKFTRMLIMLCLFLLVRSFMPGNRAWIFSKYAVLYCLAVFALIAINNLFAQSFIFAMITALLLGWQLTKRNANLRRQTGRMLQGLLCASVIGLALIYVFDFAIYPPAQHDLSVLMSTWDRVAALFLDVQVRATNPYTQVGETWVQSTVPVYFIVSIANWVILAGSLAIWLRQGVRWLWQGRSPKTQTDWFLWVFYAAFAVQGGLSVLADISGVLSANLQLRLFPSFSTIAVALVGVTMSRWRPRRLARPIALGLSLGVFIITMLSVLKVTNEPVLSNKWTFYRSDEMAALDWSDAHLKAAEIWTEHDERLASAFVTQRESSPNDNLVVWGPVLPNTHDVILTEITRLRSSRLNRSLPAPPDAFRVYDNGSAELYHLRPLTPYQP